MPVRAGLGPVERRDHLEDGLAVLHRGDLPGVERPAVAGADDVQFDVDAVLAAAHEVEVQRLRMLVRLDGRARGSQRLRGDQAAEESLARTGRRVAGR